VLDAMLAYAEGVRADDGLHRRRQHRHRRLRPRPADGGAGAGALRAKPGLRCTSSPTSTATTWPRAAPAGRARTLFIVASQDLHHAGDHGQRRWRAAWFLAQGGTDVARHFVATTTNVEPAAPSASTTTFGFWDWVGGRYSLWSAIGLPIAIAIGARTSARCWPAPMRWTALCRGPLARNLPVQLGLLDVWYRNFHGFTSRSRGALPPGPARLPAYLQQLEMESNGKRVDMDGEPLPYATSPVVWGEPGTNGQHAYFQMLHQGTDVVPVEFIAVRTQAAWPAGPAHQAAGQLPGAEPGADARQDSARAHPGGGAQRDQ
jgi:hypothetical protein